MKVKQISLQVLFTHYSPFFILNIVALSGLVYLVSAIASPFFGFLIDKTGKNVSWVLVSLAVSLLAHGILAFTHLNPYLAIIMLGVAYSILASALWSLPALLVPDLQLGTAFGIMQVTC